MRVVASRTSAAAHPALGAHGSVWDRSIVALVTLLVLLTLVSIQVLIGGTRLVFAFPAYGTLALAGVLSPLAFLKARSRPDQICLASSVVFFGYVLIRAFTSPDPYLARFDIYS